MDRRRTAIGDIVTRSVPLRRSAIRRRRPRNPIPLSVRAQVVERQGNKCLRCGEVKTLQMHHRHKLSQGGSHDSVIGLCLECHEWVEANPKKATEAGFSVQLGKVA
jgi:5-methylcytosine-specific restriction endonuclease McrA